MTVMTIQLTIIRNNNNNNKCNNLQHHRVELIVKNINFLLRERERERERERRNDSRLLENAFDLLFTSDWSLKAEVRPCNGIETANAIRTIKTTLKKVSKKLAGISQYFELGYELRSSDHATEASACCAYSLLTRVRFPRHLNVLYSPLGHGISWSLHGLTNPEIYDKVQASALLSRAIHWRATKAREWVLSFVFYIMPQMLCHIIAKQVWRQPLVSFPMGICQNGGFGKFRWI